MTSRACRNDRVRDNPRQDSYRPSRFFVECVPAKLSLVHKLFPPRSNVANPMVRWTENTQCLRSDRHGWENPHTSFCLWLPGSRPRSGSSHYTIQRTEDAQIHGIELISTRVEFKTGECLVPVVHDSTISFRVRTQSTSPQTATVTRPQLRYQDRSCYIARTVLRHPKTKWFSSTIKL